jgi:hypothetical protein
MGLPGTASAAPILKLYSVAPTSVAPGETFDYVVSVLNVGPDPTDGSPYQLDVTLPAGLAADSAVDANNTQWACAVAAQRFTCTDTEPLVVIGSAQPQNTTIRLRVTAAPAATGVLTSVLDIYGGGAQRSDGGTCASLAPGVACSSAVDPTAITSTPRGFGIDAFDGEVSSDALGDPYTQAGGHPFGVSTSFDFNSVARSIPVTTPFEGTTQIQTAEPVEPTKDLTVQAPPGLVGNLTAVTQCNPADLAGSGASAPPACAPSSQVGVAVVRLAGAIETPFFPQPVYSVLAPPGVLARFGMNVLGTIVTIDAKVRSGSDYGLTLTTKNLSEGLTVLGSDLTLWGTPASPLHDGLRACAHHVPPTLIAGGPVCSSEAAQKPFVRLPTSCAGPQLTTIGVDSWFNPTRLAGASFTSHVPLGYPFSPSEWGHPQGATGCSQVPFAPSISVEPTSKAAGSPTGLSVDLNVPQAALETPGAIAQADLRDAVVTLPRGMSLNPASADGLQACSSAQIGLLGTGFPAPNPIHFSEAEPSCPPASQIGTVAIHTPLLDEALQGSVYLAAQGDNPFDSVLAMYIVARANGVLIKLPGHIETGPGGQLTTRFDDQPQLPFSNLHLELKSGPRAPLATPSACGAYTTTTDMTPWSSPATPDATPSSSFQIDEGCSGGGFAPSFIAATANNQAAAFSPFSVTLARSDSEQDLGALQVKAPPGLLGMLSHVALCGEPQAAQGTCPAASQIGHTIAAAGVGPSPIYLPVAGQPQAPVYLTTGYHGAPFGLSVVVPAIAGPFNLGTVVERAAISVDPVTSQITISSDPLPQILDGIPLKLRTVTVTVDRPGFMFNPTNCRRMSIDGVIASAQGAAANVSSPFEVANCANLPFHPSFTVSTAGKTSKANGASLHVHLGTHEGPTNTGAPGESNIAKVDVQLPVVLPARLPTLQKACTAAQFGADPAGCPVGSFVGTAIAHTPILASPLSGPAILVSHGGQAFPDLVLVLQGEGVRINLTGHTQIKKGITFNHFETVPDAPVSSFDLTLPAGSHGVLTTDIPGRNLCATTRTVTVTKRVTRRVNGHTRKVTVKAKKAVAAPLLMPTTMTAQNGAVIHQNTKIAVTGCAKATTVKHAAKRKK